MKAFCLAWLAALGFAMACTLPGCTSSGTRATSLNTATGRVYVIGNEPFTKVALEVSAGTMYVLECAPDMEAMLRRKQGRMVKIHFTKTGRVPEGLSVKVVRTEEVPGPASPDGHEGADYYQLK